MVFLEHEEIPTGALDSWQKLLGEEFVITERKQLKAVSRATFATHRAIKVILQPADRQQTQRCLDIANSYSQTVYPISSGKNWGYGSKVPPGDSTVLIDLSRLNRILAFDEDLAYVTVEPGVTQQQLFDYLHDRHSKLWMDCTGSSPDSSLIGNVVERGFGHTPYGDRFAHVCGLEVVLPNGDCIRTGFGQFANARSTEVYRWGVGPSLDGLFSQSNLGIVTRMTFWLMPAPEYFQGFFFSLNSPDGLASVIDALRPLRMNGTLPSAIHLGNGYKVLSAIRQYPFDLTGDLTPLSTESLKDFAKSWNFGAWNGSGGMYGTRQQVAESRRLVKLALRGKVNRLRFIDEKLLRVGAQVAGPYQKITGTNLRQLLKLVRPVFNLMQGIPTTTQLRSAYWRKRTEIPNIVTPKSVDLDRDGCGLMWCAPVAPCKGNEAMRVSQIATEILQQHDFEPVISITLLTGRCLSFIIAISYDRDVDGEDDRAMACYLLLTEALAKEGYYPYRLGIQGMELMGSAEQSYRNLLANIKHAIDPRHILAPHRYILNESE